MTASGDPNDFIRLLQQIFGEGDESAKQVQAQVESAQMLRRQLIETFDEGLSTQLELLSRVATMTVAGMSGFVWTQTTLLMQELHNHLEEMMRATIVRMEKNLQEVGVSINLYHKREGSETE